MEAVVDKSYKETTPGQPKNVFADVPMNSEDSWLRVEKIAFDAIYVCGHPRGGCSSHCDLFVRIIEIARARLKAEGRIR